MGCGKSSVGKALSELLCCRFADLDEVIVEREGRSIPEIFAEDGEAEFRRMEKEALEDVLETSGTRQCAPLAPSQLSLGPSPYSSYRWLLAAKAHRAICLPLERVGKCQLRTTASYPHNNENSQQTSQEQVEDYIIQSAKEVRMVLALGGGAVMQAECEEMVHSGTLCIYLRASVETLVQRLTGEDSGRPLLKTSALRDRIQDLMRQRAATYERVAHMIIDTDGKSVREIAEEIIGQASA